MTPFFIIAGIVTTILGILAIVAIGALIIYVRVLGYPLTIHWGADDEDEPIPLTPEILEANGWIHKGATWVLLSEPRLGWHEKTHKFYMCYGELPQPVEYVHQLQLIYEVCSIHKEIIV